MNCPKCKKEISCLTYFSKVEVTQDYHGDNDYSIMEDFGSHYDDQYFCPECKKLLATTEEEADKILNR